MQFCEDTYLDIQLFWNIFCITIIIYWDFLGTKPNISESVLIFNIFAQNGTIYIAPFSFLLLQIPFVYKIYTPVRLLSALLLSWLEFPLKEDYWLFLILK